MKNPNVIVDIDVDHFAIKFIDKISETVVLMRMQLRSMALESIESMSDPIPDSTVIPRHFVGVEPTSDLVDSVLTNAFLSMIRAFTDFLDTLVAIRKICSMPSSFSPELLVPSRLIEYVEELIEERSHKVGIDGHFSGPEKYASIGTLGEFLDSAVNGYFDLRAGLEHRKGIAKAAVTLNTLWISMAIDQQVIEGPMTIQGGRDVQVQIRHNYTTRNIAKSERIRFSVKEIEDVAETLSNQVAPMLVSLFCGKEAKLQVPPSKFMMIDGNKEPKTEWIHEPNSDLN